MKKYLLLLAIASWSFSQVYAVPRTKQQALQIAEQLLDQPKALEISSSLYIYNNEEKPGFVIVSSSDKLRPVIGYSETGSIDPDDMPENLVHWLQWVDEASQFLEKHPECALTESQKSSSVIVDPLLGNIAWGQGYPFYNAIPGNQENDVKLVAGCVATAAAQCVYYHRYPETGVGSHTNANDPSQTVDFSKVSYNYDLMFDSYTSSATEAQKNEVAKLTYHCGVISDMYYSTEGSGATPLALRRGLVENLNYDPSCELIYRSCHTYEEWQSYLKSELLASRPIIFSGSTNDGSSGHCFVIDGVNDKGLYHVNWGWEGNYNGYFDVTILNPEGMGIGASSSEDEYSSNQSILIQLAPKGQLTNPVYYTSVTGSTGSFTINSPEATLGSQVTFSLKRVYNYSYTAITGKFGLAFVQNGNIVQYVAATGNAIRLKGISNYSVYGGNFSNLTVTIPSSLAAGSYLVYPCFIPSSGDFENECGIVYCRPTNSHSYTCTVNGSQVTFIQNIVRADVTASNWSFESDSIPSGTTQAVSCDVTNKDQEYTLVGKYFLVLTPPNSQAADTVFADEALTLEPNESGTLTFHKNFSEVGDWSSQLYVYYQNITDDTEDPKDQSDSIANTQMAIKVYEDPTVGANFTLLGTPTIVNNEDYGTKLYINSPATFSINVKNTGRAYTGKFQLQLFKTYTATAIIGTITGTVSVPANSEGTYTFTGNVEKLSSTFSPATSGTLYYAKATYQYGDSFIGFPTAANVTNKFKVPVYGGSPTAIESLHCGSDASEYCTDLLGRRSSSTSSGLFIRNGKLIYLAK